VHRDARMTFEMLDLEVRPAGGTINMVAAKG
jgi:hypothetical protein